MLQFSLEQSVQFNFCFSNDKSASNFNNKNNKNHQQMHTRSVSRSSLTMSMCISQIRLSTVFCIYKPIPLTAHIQALAQFAAIRHFQVGGTDSMKCILITLAAEDTSETYPTNRIMYEIIPIYLLCMCECASKAERERERV